jgi:hypothetical protein
MPDAPFVTMVYPVNVIPLWEQAAKLLEPAVARSGTHEMEDVRRCIMAGNAQLWVQWNDGICEAAIVTEFKHYPKGLWLHIWLAGAEGLNDDLLEQQIFRFAEESNCAGVSWTGRPGWKRRRSNLNLNTQNVVYHFDMKRSA